MNNVTNTRKSRNKGMAIGVKPNFENGVIQPRPKATVISVREV